MKFVGSCCVLAAVVAAAAAAALNPGQLPPEVKDHQQFLRDKRSSYGTPYYAPAPCASAHLPSLAPAYIAPIHHAAYAPSYGYGIPALPHYRSVDDQEIMSFSDMEQGMSEQMMVQQMMAQQMEHMPMARYAYGAPAIPTPAVAAPHYGAIAGLAAPGSSAIGVFPNANTGGCSVPLLLSCSPSISSGHIVKSHYGGEAYRVVDDQHPAHEDHETHEQSQMNQPTHDATSQLPLHQ